MEKCKGRVYKYESSFLHGDNHSPHYHIVLVDIQIGRDEMEKKGVVIVTTHTPDREVFYKKRGGGDSLVIIGRSECPFLSHQSIVSGQVYEEDVRELELLQSSIGSVSGPVLEKIREAARNHTMNSKRVKRLL